MDRRRTAWMLVAAVVVGWLVGPQVVNAATGLVRIQDGAGSARANVTDGHQLMTAETAPPSFHEYSAGTGDTICHVVATIPANKGFVIRSIAVDVITPSAGGIEVATLYPNASCAGSGDIYGVSTHVRAGHAVSLDPGFAVAPGGKISLRAFADSVVSVHIWGYMVPASDVPATTKVN
ncbi:MAG TPA: hypothetical protein VID47_18055 [Actinomycetota bacterium]|jgi:hypothetical protein